VGLKAGLDGCGKSRPPPGFDPWNIQPVAKRLTTYYTQYHMLHVYNVFS